MIQYEFKTARGIDMVARLILKGDAYGLSHSLKADKPLIEFNTASGGHISRYHLETFLMGWPLRGDDTALARGICLEGSTREFDLEAGECRSVVANLFMQLVESQQ